MEIFINELSLEGQYYQNEEFEQSVRIIVELLALLKSKTPEIVKIYRSNEIMQKLVLNNENFSQAFQHIKNKDLQKEFKEFVLKSIDWKQESNLKKDDDFYHLDIPNEKIRKVNDSSLAEITERLLNNPNQKILIINFHQSSFSKKDEVTILKLNNKSQKEIVDIYSFDNQQQVETWLELEFEISKISYDFKSKIPPTDMQTILRDTKRFTKTAIKVQGRIVYEDIKKNTLWYVDNFHFGESSHLEVYNKQKEHLGEADLNGNLDVTKADTKKNNKI